MPAVMVVGVSLPARLQTSSRERGRFWSLCALCQPITSCAVHEWRHLVICTDSLDAVDYSGIVRLMIRAVAQNVSYGDTGTEWPL